MTQQTSGMPELKYSEETFRDMYEALKNIEVLPTVLKSHNYELILKTLAKAEGKS